MGRDLDRQKVYLDRSTTDALLNYFAKESTAGFKHLVSMPGSRFAYKHHRWSTPTSKETIQEFWECQLDRLPRTAQSDQAIEEIIRYLITHRRQWLEGALRFLPEGHLFDTRVYLICGYDSVVYGEDVTLNIGFKQYHEDHREALYYLIHELAHAGYLRYHRMPDLAGVKAVPELIDTVKLLTHLEGMGVISPLALRRKEGGFRDHDYRVLSDEKVTKRRVREYFEKLTELESEPDRKFRKTDSQMLNYFSAGPRRLWYIAGGHMAIKIEESCGGATLQDLVKEGHDAFFETYRDLEDPLQP